MYLLIIIIILASNKEWSEIMPSFLLGLGISVSIKTPSLFSLMLSVREKIPIE